MRHFLQVIIGVFLLAIAIRTFALIGLIAPARISAGSMAPHLVGPHWKLECGDCGAEYSVGADAPPQAGRTVCPRCRATVLIGDAPLQEGNSLIIDRTAFLLRAPARWETVVFRCPEDAKALCVKRIIGLPGERISLVHGDVYVDGKLVRKSLAEQRAMRILVHVEDNLEFPRFSSEHAETGWQFDRVFEPGLPRVWFFIDSSRRLEPGRDLLIYRTVDGRILDDTLPYHVGVPSVANPTTDLMLSGKFYCRGGGDLLFRCGDGESAWWVEFDTIAHVLRLWHGNRLAREVPLKFKLSGNTSEIELSMIDRQITVAVDGRVRLNHKLADPLAPSSRPFAIATKGMDALEVRELSVWRDVVYTPLPGGPVAEEARDATWQLEANEYFVVGDNPAVSADSRTWRGGPGLSARWIVGQPLIAF